MGLITAALVYTFSTYLRGVFFLFFLKLFLQICDLV